MNLLDDFLWRAIFAGLGIAIVAGPLGCFVVWRRMAYLGDTLSHSSLLGIALGFLLQINLIVSVFTVAALVAVLLFLLQRQKQLTSDAILGTLAHASLALGVLVISLMTWIRIDLMSFLFGDILSVEISDLYLIYGSGALVLLVMMRLWKPLLAITVNEELARAEGIPSVPLQLIFMLLIALVIALAMKIVGVLLVTALLIIPATAARRFSKTPEQMALIAILIGVISVLTGLYSSLQFDTPSGPSIVIAIVLFFSLSFIVPAPKSS